MRQLSPLGLRFRDLLASWRAPMFLRRPSDMAYLGYMDDDERQMLHDLVHTFVVKLNTERRLTEDLSRQLEAANQRLRLLEAVNYGLV